MPVSVDEILTHHVYDPNDVDRVSRRKKLCDVAIVPPDSTWPQKFQALKARIEAALGPVAVSVAHAGSTSVPGLPAKDVIDVDLTVRDIFDEDSYVKPLEAAGFHFLFREPNWHQHRFFVEYEPMTNLHVFGPDCPEVERHRIFREWLVEHEDDRELYAKVKKEAADATVKAGERVHEYNDRKEYVIQEILERAFRSLGYIQ